jgi:S-adenosyl-L-methionine hydrolase (adenosine-forming)
MTIIGLLTDFGLRGGHYVAEMKGVGYQISPKAQIVDVMHNITPFSIREAAYALFTVYDTFPPGTIFVAVVDPGVGSGRDILAVQTVDNYFLVGPDNGLFSYFITQEKVAIAIKLEEEEFFYPPFVEIINQRRQRQESINHIEDEAHVPEMENIDFMTPGVEHEKADSLWAGTFHGRDIMVPVAAHLANGLEIFSLGTFKEDLEVLEGLEPELSDDQRFLTACAQYIDSFGNIITNIPITQFYSLYHQTAPFLHLHFQDKDLQLKVTQTFAGNPPAQLLLVEGSSGFMEICLNQGAAEEALAMAVGDSFRIEFLGGLFSEFSPQL